MKPDELLPDGIDSIRVNSQTARKGTIGAFIQNTLILANPQIDADTRTATEADLLELLPIMKALQVFEVFDIRDPKIRELIEARLNRGSI